MNRLSIGILGFQGAIEEHVFMTKRASKRIGLNCKLTWVKTVEDVKCIDGLIIPGGESTTIGKLATFHKTLQAIKVRVEQGMPIFGTCAGLIMMARKVYDRVVDTIDATTLDLMDITVERNSFGRQKESFGANLEIPCLGREPFQVIFIRAPTILEVGPDVEVLGKLGTIIAAVQKGDMIGTVFHPELTTDTRFHEYFLRKL
jgi:5'-phosphate synthase pdxT subunit